MQQATTSAQIIPFPQRNKGRIRKTSSANAEGLLAMHQFNASGPNIEVFNTHRVDAVDRSDYLSYIAATIINTLPAKQRTAVKQRALCDAALGKDDRQRVSGALLASSFRAFS